MGRITKCDVNAKQVKLDCKAMIHVALVQLSRCKDKTEALLQGCILAMPENSAKLLTLSEELERTTYNAREACEVLHALYSCYDPERECVVINREEG